MSKRGIPLASIERIIKAADPGIRVSDSAKLEIKAELEEYAAGVAARAQKLAGHARRRTIKEKDVLLASHQS